jgi:acetyltransferase
VFATDFGDDSVSAAADGAGSVGRTVLWSLLNPAFRGRIYPVNTERSEVLGIMAYDTIAGLMVSLKSLSASAHHAL